MKPDELDRLLSREPAITPSRDFAASVMQAVHAEAVAPPPIPFPWTRALAGMLPGAVALAGLVAMGLSAEPEPVDANISSTIVGIAEMATTPSTVWTLVGTLITAACIVVSMQFADLRARR